ncbi:SUMF1/EgtB/PvdO family nonheme iron enzyme [Kamptonema cortianum]|nr:SUMF1/EgtB/PvdO family nonheme iron enzyme [Geitlerinema splendidum]MDK3157085.1 SUMF1/EgtB/PvdO family nonheme iron enzyme [Kamptonema cortianum]
MNPFFQTTRLKAGYRTAVLTFSALLAAQTLGNVAPQMKSFTESIPDSVVKFDMVAIPGGKVQIDGKMVEVKPLYVAKHEAVWELFDEFLASGEPSPPYDQTEFSADAIARPSKTYILPDLGWGHNGYPVINVAYTNVMMFCRWLSSVTGKKYRLPTEAEWEWACRGGKSGEWKVDAAQMEAQAWFAGNSGKMTHPVGKKAPNAFGLHDMFGNAGEWATDMNGEPVLCGGTFLDPIEKMLPGIRQRWSPKWQESDPQLPKSRWWLSDGKFVGFRLVCEG